MNARRRAVERDLPDGNPHAARALVAESEDSFIIRDDDQPNVAVNRVSQQIRNPIDIVRRNPNAARTAENVAVSLAGATHRGRIDEGHQLREVLDQHAVEQGLVAILKGRKPDELFQVVGFVTHVLEFQGDLFLDRQLPRWEESRKAKGPAFC